MLIVVGILVVLLGVGFVALMNHMRNLHQKEMDGQAKEIFVAAQNHLSMAYSQGYLGKIAFKDVDGVETSTGDFGTAEDPEKGIFYFITTGVSAFGSDTVLDQMLPVASVDETARTGGSYIIRYQKEPARVLDVFYVSTSGRYSHTFSSDEYDLMMALRDKGSESHRNERNKFNFPEGDQGVVIGYYGGELAAEIPNGFELEAPIVEIENNERLKIKVTNTNKKLSDAPSGEGNTEKYQNTLTLVIAHTNESQPVTIKLIDNGTPLESLAKYDLKYDSTKDQFTLTLDDITAKNMHFAEVMGENYTPGENILVFASASNTNVWTNVADSGRQITNSLFASRSGDTVHIANFRHFMNLESTVSGLTLANMVAEQDGDMSWYDAENDKSFLTKTGAKGVILKDGDSLATAEYCLYPISHDNLTYHGNGHVISDVKVNTSVAAGLFRALDFSTVSDVELLNFDVESTGSHAGALAGSATSSDISGVLVRNDPLKEKENELEITASGSSGSAGGMVGHMTNGSVEMCAAAVYVNSTGSAGGLIGTVVSSVLKDTEPSERKTVSIKNSYSGGHTNELEYTELTSGTDAGRINVIAAKKAGGLIGDSSDAKLNLDYCYSTSSASGEEATGGLIGVAGAGQVRHSYAVGLVINGGSGDSMKRGAFVGDKGSLDLLDAGENPQQTNAYLEGLSKDASQSNLIALAKTSADMVNTNQLFSTSPMEAMTYDQKLSSRFSFRTIKELHDYFEETSSSFEANYFTEAHYGDWQLPTMEILHYTLVNSDQLYSVIDLGSQTTVVSVGVKGEKSGQARVYVLSVDRENKTVTAQTSYCVDVNGNSIIGASKNDELWLPCKVNENAGNLKLTVYLDDVKQTIEGKNGHFGYLFASNTGTYEDKNLLPGENITLLVGGGSCSWAELTTLLTKKYPADAEHADKGKIIALSDNSLFAKTAGLASAENRTLEKPYENTNYASELAKIADAEIKLLRHLQNLDADTSGVNASEDLADDKQVKTAKQIGHISWTDQEIWNLAGSGSVNCFNGIYNQFLTEYDGDHWSIIDLPIEATSTGYASSNNSDTGLFRYIRAARIIDDGDPDTVDVSDGYTMTIKNLRLKDVTVTGASGGSAGAVVGMNEGVLELNTVLADGSADYGVSGANNSGGLVGLSNKTLTINNSASALLVSGTTAAGGLLGCESAGSVTIYDSYVGGHTSYSDGGSTVTRKYYVGAPVDGSKTQRWNIMSASGAAGGLIGKTDAGTTAIEQTFNAASVYSGTKGAAGGLIGVANGTFQAVSRGGVLDLVYTIAPVNLVEELSRNASGSYEASTDTGNGSAFGSVATALSGKMYFQPTVFTDPLPVNLVDSSYPNGVSNIQAVGSIADTDSLPNVLQTVKPIARVISSDSESSVDTSVLGLNNHMVVTTETFDSAISLSYPYAVWTSFDFRSATATPSETEETYTPSTILYYRGDWQPMSQVTAIQLVAHFVSVVPDEKDPTKVKTYVTEPDETFTVAVPYEYKTLIIPYAQSVLGYTLDDHWNLFNGNFTDTSTWSAHNIGGGSYTANASDPDTTKTYSDVYVDGSFGMGQTVVLSAEAFALINDEANYKDKTGAPWDETSGEDPYVHVTFVSQYDAETKELYQLDFYDYDPATETYGAAPCGSLILEAGKDDLPDTLAELWEKENNSGKKAPSRYLSGQRFLGWSAVKSQDVEDQRAFANELQSDDSYLLVFDEDAADEISVMDASGKPIKVLSFYAQYRPIVMSTLTIKYRDANEDEIDELDDMVIQFESDRGFNKAVTLYSWSVPDTFLPDADTQALKDEWAGYVTAKLNTMPPKATFNIPAKTNITTGVDYQYILKYKDMQGGGYAILFELLHTAGDANSTYDTYTYNANSSVVVGRFGSINDSGISGAQYGVVEEDEQLVVDPGELTPILTKLCGNHSNHFEFTTYGADKEAFALIELDSQQNVPSSYGTAYSSLTKGEDYPATVPDPANLNGPRINVKYLVIMQCARQTYELSYDADGGVDPDPDLVEYGAYIQTYTNQHSGDNAPDYGDDYDFDYWYLTSKSVPVSSDDRMPASNETVHAKWTGSETAYTVSFWFENADDAGYSYKYSFVIDPDTARDQNHPLKNLNETNYATYFKSVGDPITANWFMGKFDDTDFPGMDDDHFEYDATLSGNKKELTVEAGGNTLLKVYFKRKTKTIEFWRHGEWKEQTDDDGGTYFGYVNGDWVELTRGDASDTKWYPEYVYSSVTSPSTTGSVQYFGLVNEEYFPLSYVSSSDGYTQVPKPDDGDTGEYFGKRQNGEYTQLQWNNDKKRWDYWSPTSKKWKQYDTSRGFYVKSTAGSSWNYYLPTTSTSHGYYYVINDSGVLQPIELWYSGGHWYTQSHQNYSNHPEHIYSGEVYSSGGTYDTTGGFYTRTNGTEEWTEAKLSRSGSYPNYSYNDYSGSGDCYGKDIYDGHVKLISMNETWTYTTTENYVESAPIPYTGVRYRWRNDNGKNNVYHRWTGKWKSSFASNGYDWNTLTSGYTWQESNFGEGTIQTYLEAFSLKDSAYNRSSTYLIGSVNQTVSVYRLYGTVISSIKRYILHYREDVDGNYTSADPPVVVASTSTGDFNLTTKFPQFRIEYYKTTYNDSNHPSYSASYDKTNGSKVAWSDDNNGNTTYTPNKISGSSNNIHVYHERLTYKLTFMNGGTKVAEIDVPYDKKLEDISYDDLPNAIKATLACPMSNPAGYKFRGWARDAVGEEVTVKLASPITQEPGSLTDVKMPEGGMVLYAKWTRDPLEVSFTIDKSKAKFLKSDGTALTDKPDVSWPNPAPTVTSFSKNNATPNPVPYGGNISTTVADTDGKLLDSYKPVSSNTRYVFSHWAYMGIVYGDDGKPVMEGENMKREERTFRVSGSITEDMELYPVFTEKALDEITVHVYYKLPDGTEHWSKDVKVRYNRTGYFKIEKLTDEAYKDYELDPPFFYGVIDDEFLETYQYNPTDDSCKYVFNYVNRAAAWGYTVEYRLKLADGSSIPILTETVSGLNSEYVFRAFYALPSSMSGYEFDKLVFPDKLDSNNQPEESTDAVILIRRGEINTLQVIIKPVISAIVKDEVVEYYTGKEHDIAALFYNRLPQIGTSLATVTSGTVGTLTAAGFEFTVSCRYAVGSADATDVKPVNAGIYRLDIQIKLKMTDGSGNEYVVWKTKDYVASENTRPDIVLTIQPRQVKLTSETLDKIFRDNATNNPPATPYFDSTGKLTAKGKEMGYPYDASDSDDYLKNARMLDVAKSDLNTEFVTVVVQKLDSESDGDYADFVDDVKDHLIIGLLAESFRRSASAKVEGEYTYTPNAFSYEVKSGFDTDNFNIFKEYGEIYYWDSLADYNDYKNPTTSTGGGSGSGGEGGE